MFAKSATFFFLGWEYLLQALRRVHDNLFPKDVKLTKPMLKGRRVPSSRTPLAFCRLIISLVFDQNGPFQEGVFGIAKDGCHQSNWYRSARNRSDLARLGAPHSEIS